MSKEIENKKIIKKNILMKQELSIENKDNTIQNNKTYSLKSIKCKKNKNVVNIITPNK